MRVIAGAARGRPLKGPRGTGTRPTSDKVKGAIFSMLESLRAAIEAVEGATPAALAGAERPTGPDAGGVWSGLRALDLYAGTGALGIEALSRGAARVDFVDANASAQRLIRENLRLTGLASRARVSGATVQQALAGAAAAGLEGPYDVALLDAPYGDPGLESAVVSLAGSGLLAGSALVVVEHSRRSALAESYGDLRLVRRRRHGDTEVSIYLLAEEAARR